MNNTGHFFTLKGQTIRSIEGLYIHSESVKITTDEFVYDIFHIQDCCEDVEVNKIGDNIDDILNEIIILAEEDVSDCEGTLTRFTLQTKNGIFNFSFLGRSNGYYSETVDITKKPIRQDILGE